MLRKGFPGPLWYVAIAEEPDSVTLYSTPGNPKIAGLIEREGNHSRSETVEAWTLDEFDQAAGHDERILLWMDIEGYELPAIRSGPELLTSGRVRWINVEECRGDPADPRWTDPRELRAALEALGYVRACDYNRHPSHQDVIYIHHSEPRKR